jgi:hypothetical protein
MKRVWPRFGPRGLVAAAILCWAATSATLMIGDRFRPNLTKHAEGLVGLADLRDRPGLCGVGLLGIPWHDSGGYTWLHRNVPIYPVRTPDDLDAAWDAFNSALAPKDAPLPALGFRRERCYAGGFCAFHRAGPCTARPDRAVNEDLRRRKQ